MKKYIISKPDIMGGAPCIMGTRISIDVILYRLRDGYTIKELHKMYPWVELKTFEGVLEELAGKINKLQDDQKISQAQTTVG